MKKMKKSLKYVLISLCAVFVLAAAIVSTILLVRKPNEPAAIEKFTAKQQILLGNITKANSIKKAEATNSLVETTSVLNENNEVISQDDIYAFYNGYFVALDENGNKILYLEHDGTNVNVLERLASQQKLKSSASNISAEKVKANYLLYSYEYTENEKTFKAFEIVDFSNIKNLTIVNEVSFEIKDNKLYVGEGQIKNLKINLFDGYFEVCYDKINTSTAYANEVIESEKYLKNIYNYGDSQIKQSFEYANLSEVSISETQSEDGSVFVRVLETKAEFVYKTTDSNENEVYKTYSYDFSSENSYVFFVTNYGVFVESRVEVGLQSINEAVMIDGKLYKYSYELFNVKTEALEDVNLSEGMVRASFASQNEFLIVFEQPRDYMSASKTGAMCYYDKTGELVLNYSASSIESVVKYSNNGRFVTDDGIFVCKGETSASLAYEFKTEQRNYKILSENIDSDWFVVRDENTKASYILSIKGEIAFNEMFVSVLDFGSGYFLTTKNGKRHLIMPSENQKTLIENFTGFYEFYLPQFGMYLSEDGENLYTLYNCKNEVIEAGVSLEVVARENYVALITTKNNSTKMYCLVLGENLGDGTAYFVNAQDITDGQSGLIDNASHVDEVSNEHSDDCVDCEEHGVCCSDATCEDCIAEQIISEVQSENLNQGNINLVSNMPYADSGEGVHTHSYTTSITKQPTCTSSGVRTHTCSCGDSYTSTIPATGHDYSVYHAAKAPTCTDSGYYSYYSCSECGAKSGYVSRPATGHDWRTNTSYNCTTNGRLYCANCGATKSDSHNYETETADATRSKTTLKDSDTLTYTSNVSTSQSGIDDSANQIISYSYPTKIYITQKGYSYYNDYVRHNSTETIECQKTGCTASYQHTYVSSTSLSSDNYVTVSSQNYEITISESNGQLTASGGGWSVTITENFTDVGTGGTIDFAVVKSLVTAYSPESNGFTFSFGADAWYQPQEKITYSITFHKDTPYYESTTLDHSCSSTDSANTGDYVSSGISYFDWSEETSINDTVTSSNKYIQSHFFNADLYAGHYTWVGWMKGSNYKLNESDPDLLTLYDGYALGVQFTAATHSVDLCGVFDGNSITIEFLSSYGSNTILTRSGNATTYSAKTLTTNIDGMADDALIEELGEYQTKKTISNVFDNVKPADLHSTIISKANEIYSASTPVLITRNYIHEGWAVWDPENQTALYYNLTDNGVTVSANTYTDFRYVSGTYPAAVYAGINTANKTIGDVVYVMAVYRLKRYEIETNSVTNSESSWRVHHSSDSSLELADSYNPAAVGFASNATIRWSYTNNSTASNWTLLSDASPNFSTNSGASIYINIAINIEGHDYINDLPDRVAKLYRFSTITISDYYGKTGKDPTSRTFVLNYNQSSNNETAANNANWTQDTSKNVGDVDSNDIVIVANAYKSTSSKAAMVTFCLKTRASLTQFFDKWLNRGENGCNITIGELVPIYDQYSYKTVYQNDSVNVTFDGAIDGYDFYDVRQDSSGSGTIKSSSGTANYYESSFSQINSVTVDTENYYDNTHMMVIKPKTKNVYSMGTNDNSGSVTSRLIISNYISNITADYGYAVRRYDLDTTSAVSSETYYTTTDYSKDYDNILDYHNLLSDVSGENTIEYDGKTYTILRGERETNLFYEDGYYYYIYFDLYIGKAERDGSQSPYEDDYAYFLFYSGKIHFSVTMTDIEFGEIDVDDSTEGTYSADNAKTGDYKDFSNYADWVMGAKKSDSNVSFAKSKLEELAITNFSTLAIQPQSGFLIEEIIVTLTPKDGEFDTALTRTYTLDYTNADKSAAVVMSGDYFTLLRYKYEDSEITFDEKVVTINDLVHLQIASPGYGDGGWTGANDIDSKTHGIVWLGMSKVIDNISISYKVVSYLDVLFKQFKNIDVYSYLKNTNLGTNTFNKNNYQSDFAVKSNTWFNDTTLSQIYVSSDDEKIIKVPNAENSSHSDNYYYQTRLYLASDYTNLAIAYNKITGYLLNENSYFSIELSAGNETNLGNLNTLLGGGFDNTADTIVNFDMLRTAAIDAFAGANINKYALGQNSIEANYFSDPVAYTIKYGTVTDNLYFDQKYTLKSYYSAAPTGYKEKEGYSFVGWVSNADYEVTGGTEENQKMIYDSNYGYLFTCEEALAGLIGSNWYFGRTENGVALYSTDKDGNIVNDESVYSDFYVDEARFISDTGFYESGQIENYNFFCIGDAALGHEYFIDDGSGEFVLYPVWMANDYTLKFTLNDGVMDDIDNYGSTETLFRVNDASFDYLKNTYTANLNNGFNFKLTYNGGATYNNLKLQVVDGVNVAATVPEFYVYVRYDTKEWYFSNSDGSRLVYYQDFFVDGIAGEVNADRYGYSFVEWIMKNNEPFTEAQLFDSEFYGDCDIAEISKIYYSYKNNPHKSASATVKEAYTYGKNGELFEISKREINDAEYKGCKVEHYVTNRLTGGTFRTAAIEAEWTTNKYYIRVQDYGTYDFSFVDGDSYEIIGAPFNANDVGDYCLSDDLYVFDSDEYNTSPKNICDYLLQIPYRHGYDFAGWTFAYDKMDRTDENNLNDIAELNKTYENYWYEQLYYKEGSDTIRQYQGLCDDLLRYYNYYKVDDQSKPLMNDKIEYILFYSETIQGEGTAELLGDIDADKNHYVNFYANWTPMLYSIEVDLNIPEDYEDISNELFAGLFEPEMQDDGSYKHVLDNGLFANGIMEDGFRVDENGIAFFNYMKDNKTYKAAVSNTSFKMHYGMTLGEAVLELIFEITDAHGNVLDEETIKFGIADLYVKLNNHNFLGWKLFGYDSDKVWNQIASTIDLEEKYLENYADNFVTVSNHGDVLVYENGSWTRRAILRDIVVEDNNNDGEEIVTERLYIECAGDRYYLKTLDHNVSENVKNDSWNFSDEYLFIVVDDKEYYLYENENYGFYVLDAFKEEVDEDGNVIEKHPEPTTNIFEISSSQHSSLLSGVNSSVIKELKIRKYRKFEIEATWSEVDVNSIDYELKFENVNNSSTGIIYYQGEPYNVYYKEVLNVNTGDVSKGLVIQVLNDEGVYEEKIVIFYYNWMALGFNEKYLVYNGYDIMLNSAGEPYYNFVEANGTITPTVMEGTFMCYAGGVYCTFDISQIHHFSGYNQYANTGLGGVYLIETDSKSEIKTDSEIVDNGDGTYTENGFGEFEFNASFEYGETAYIKTLPYYNGRYLTEIAFEFRHIFEDDILRKSFTDVGLANYVDVRLVFDLFWDSENRTIGIEKVEFYRRDQEEVLWTIKRKENLRGCSVDKDAAGNILSIKFKDYTDIKNPVNTSFGYYDWWRSEDAIDIENSKRYDKLLDFIDSYFGFMLPEDGDLSFEEFISIGRYIDTEDGQEKFEGREDVNVVNLTLKQLKKPLTLAMKFSVQTFDVNVYSVLNDSYDQALKTEGVIDSPYNSLDDLEDDIDYTNTMISKDYEFDVDDDDYPKFATIIGDSDASGEKKILEEELEKNQIIAAGGEVPEEEEGADAGKVSTYNVPYGYFAYGYNLDSSYVGDRPIDTEENKEIIANPIYGLSYIYLSSLYYYKDSELLFTAANSDLINSKALKETDQKPTYDGDNINLGMNSPLIGDPEKFLQSVRADKELIYYNFGGLFFIDNKDTADVDGRVKFRGVSEDDEKSHLNKNYFIYAYYYIRTTATEAGFYAWDDASSSYQKIEDINDGYAYYKLDKDESYVLDENNILVHVDGKPLGNVMYTFKEVGIDTEKFASDFDYIPDFGEDEELEEEYLEYLKLVSELYWFICNDGIAVINGISNLSGLMYNEKSKMYYDASDNYYALVQQRNHAKTYYGATLYKKTHNKSQSINKTNYDLYEKVTNITSFNPATDDVSDYVVFKDYYVVYDGEYYKIETYSETKFNGTYYSPMVEYFVDSNGTHYGNSVKLPTGENGEEVTYYFNYETQKLYQPNQLGVEVEVSDFSYQIKTPVNDNYDVSVIERSTGFGLYGISLVSIPDSSVSYWMPDREFLFWAAITQEELNSLLQYEADMTSEAGKVYTTLLNQFKLLNPTEEQIKAFTDELNEKLKKYTFKDLLSAGVNVKQFYYDKDTHAVDRVELEFVVDLGVFASLTAFSAAYPEKRMPINISTDFDILEAGSAMVSSLFGIQVYKRVNFETNSYSSIDADYIDKDYFELYGDSIYYYTEKFGDYVRFAELTASEHNKMLSAVDKAATLDEIIKTNADEGVDIVKALNYVTQTVKVDANGDIVYDEHGNIEYVYNYNTVTRSSSSKYLYAFYYKANMPEGSEPYVVAVAKY